MNELLRWLLSLTLAGTAMALLLWLLRRVAGKYIRNTVYYYAWLLVLLRFILPIPGLVQLGGAQTARPPVQTAARTERAGRTDRAGDVVYKAEPEGAIAHAIAEAGTDGAADAGEAAAAGGAELTAPRGGSAGGRFSMKELLLSPGLYLVLWGLGFTASLLGHILSYSRFRRSVYDGMEPAAPRETELLATLCPGRTPSICRINALPSPMLIGLVRPVIALPQLEYDKETLENILRHELRHYRRGDIRYKWFAALVLSAQWFNPVAILIRRELNSACELSCDEQLLEGMDQAQARSYGNALLSMAADADLPRRVMATTFSTEKRDMQERLEQIMKFKSKGRTALLSSVIIALLLCGCGAVAGPARPDVTAIPTAAVPETAVPKAAMQEKTAVTVSTVDELLAAIAPNTEIQLEPGEYNLTAASDYGRGESRYYSWENAHGTGFELEIKDVSNMSISAELGAEGLPVTGIVTEPRMANVLCLEDCSDIGLSGLVLGHTEEQGVCSGGVVKLEEVCGAVLDSCELFGCGTYGLMTDGSENVTLQNSVIRHCTVGAASVAHSRDVVIKDSKIYDCGEYILLDYSNSTDCAVLNCQIYENTAQLLLRAQYSRDVNLLGCQVRDNSFHAGVFQFVKYSAAVAGCQFKGNSQPGWYDNGAFGPTRSMPAVDPDNVALTEEQLESMAFEKMEWTHAASAPLQSSGGDVTVSTVDELLAAIAPNTTITLADGVYDLSTASDYGTYGSRHYYWQSEFDGPELVISGVEGLAIIGGGADKVTIAAIPRYADVLHFDDCDGLRLSGLTAGHTQEPGSCSGGVVYLSDCEDTEIQGCVLYGCGTIGVDATDCHKLTVADTEIKECSFNAASLHDCKDVTFTNCNIHDIDSGFYFNVGNCENTLIDGEPLSSETRPTKANAAAVTPAPAGADNKAEKVLIYYNGTEMREFLLHVGDPKAELDGIVAPLTLDSSLIEWSCSDPEALSLSKGSAGGCIVEALKAVKGGVTLTASYGELSANCTVYIVP